MALFTSVIQESNMKAVNALKLLTSAIVAFSMSGNTLAGQVVLRSVNGVPVAFDGLKPGINVFFCELDPNRYCVGLGKKPDDLVVKATEGKAKILEYRYYTKFDPVRPEPNIPISVYITFKY